MREQRPHPAGDVPLRIAPGEAGQQRQGRGVLRARQQGQIVGGYLGAQHLLHARVGTAQARGEDHGEAREGRTVQAHEGHGGITHGRTGDRADDIQFRGVVGGFFGRPGGGQAATGVAPQSDARRAVQSERRKAQCRTDSVQRPEPGFAGGPEMPAQPFVIRHRDRPSAFQRGGDERQLQLRNGAERPGAML